MNSLGGDPAAGGGFRRSHAQHGQAPPLRAGRLPIQSASTRERGCESLGGGGGGASGRVGCRASAAGYRGWGRDRHLPRRVFPPGKASAATTHTVAIPSARPAVSLNPRSPPSWCAACVHDGEARCLVFFSPAAEARTVWGHAVPAQQGDHRRPLHWRRKVPPCGGPCARGRADL